jgi:hypothetical protein
MTASLCLRLAPLLGAAVALSSACADRYETYNSYYYGSAQGGEGGAADPGSGGATITPEGEGGAGGEPVDDGHLAYPDAPHADVSVAEHGIDVFGHVGHRFWFGVSAEQLGYMNEGVNNGGGIPEGPVGGDLYTPGDADVTFADHVWVTSADEDGKIADYGKVQVKLAGQSTQRPWSKRSIPNFNIDTNEFVDKQRLGGFEHLRFNNAQVGSIFREWLTLEIYRKLGYPAPLATFAWVSSNVWGKDTAVPMVLVERYKRSFCKRTPELGGSCLNMWEFAGDFIKRQDPGPLPPKPGNDGPSIFDDPNNCQFSECDNTRVKELEQLIANTPPGEGFKAATEERLDWPAFHRFQCLSWVLATGDDALHNSNNVVLAEREDGKFQYLPYSVDLSLGHDWYPVVTLAGQNSVARGCQADKSCWADTIAACEDVLAAFTDADPVSMLDELHDTLDGQDMLRAGDEARYETIRGWFEARLTELPAELEANRETPQICPEGQVDCGGFCTEPVNCPGMCEPPVGKAAGLAPALDECPAITAYGM